MSIKEVIINPYNPKNKLINIADVKNIFASFNQTLMLRI